MEAATQPRDGCAAGMRNGRGAGRTPTKVSEEPKRGLRLSLCECVPTSEPASGEQCSTPRPAHAAGRRLSLVKRHRESRARSVRPLRVGDGPSRFLGGKRWKKPETASIIARTTERMEGPGRGNRPMTPRLLAPISHPFRREAQGPSSATASRSECGAPTAGTAPVSGHPPPRPAPPCAAWPGLAGPPAPRGTRPGATSARAPR